MHIKDRTFVVSGGASGLGRASVTDLHSQGGHLAILDLNEDSGAETVSSLGSTRAKFFQCDVADPDSVSSAVSAVLSWVSETGKPIGGVVAAAGVGFPGKVIDRKGRPVPLDNFDRVVRINLHGTIDLIRQLLPAIVKNEPVSTKPTAGSPGPGDAGDGERGVLILVSSVAAYDGQPGQLAYSASKGAIRSLVLPLARDVAEYGVRCVAIAPGVFESNMTSMMSDKVKKSLMGVMEFPKRMGRAEEFARLVREVIGNAMINATTIRLDGAVRMPSRM